MTHIAIPGVPLLAYHSDRPSDYRTDDRALCVSSESITLGLPERDEDIRQVCRCIEAAGKAGLRGLNYNFLVSNRTTVLPPPASPV